jgi:hypothetical protein
MTLAAADVSFNLVSAAGCGCDLRMLCANTVGSKSVVGC